MLPNMKDLNFRKIVIKVGSNVLTNGEGQLDLTILGKLANQISQLKKEGKEIILISSGAVASGRNIVKLPPKYDSISARQVLASVGQVKLLNHYYELFSKQQIICSQVLVTKEDFRDRNHYLNMRNCLSALLQNNILPIINENDVISITELMFTDNDELAGLIATMMNAELLVILSNVEGIYSGDPKNPDSVIINKIEDKSQDISKFIQNTKSEFGRGGMITKSNMARKVAKSGITVKIANGKRENILSDLLTDKNYSIGTTFIPVKTTSSSKKMIAFSDTFAKGVVYINEGAQKALFSSKASSLLPVGIISIEGEFQKGDVVKIVTTDHVLLGLGKVEYSSKKAREIMGQKNQKPVIHYDYLYLNE